MRYCKPQIFIGFLAVSAFGQVIHRDEKARVAEVLWLVNYDSEAPALRTATAIVERPGSNYEALKVAWQLQANSPDASAKTLANAAYFFRASEPGEAIRLLVRARVLEPNNPDWLDDLAELYAAQIEEGCPRILAELLETGDLKLREAVAMELKQRAAVDEYLGINAYRR